jgi:predicted RNase H-like nuclease (RuvC/YqgF family)
MVEGLRSKSGVPKFSMQLLDPVWDILLKPTTDSPNSNALRNEDMIRDAIALGTRLGIEEYARQAKPLTLAATTQEHGKLQRLKALILDLTSKNRQLTYQRVALYRRLGWEAARNEAQQAHEAKSQACLAGEMQNLARRNAELENKNQQLDRQVKELGQQVEGWEMRYQHLKERARRHGGRELEVAR